MNVEPKGMIYIYLWSILSLHNKFYIHSGLLKSLGIGPATQYVSYFSHLLLSMYGQY